MQDFLFLGSFAIVMAVIGLGFFYLAYVGAPGYLARLARNRERYREQPWLAKRPWRSRRIIYSTGHRVWFMWFWCAAWWLIVGFLFNMNHDAILAALRGPWSEAIPASIPFVAGIIGLLAAVSLTWQRIFGGDAVFLLDTLPGWLGDNMRGTLVATLKEKPNEPVRVRLTCGLTRLERVLGTDGNWHSELVTEELWTTEAAIEPEQTMFGRNGARIPVDIALPVGQPESGDILDDPQVIWKLSFKAGSVLDKALNSEFEVPVFERGIRS